MKQENNWEVLYEGVKHLDFGVSGIYKITNITNGKFYIGSAICFRKRILDHISKLKRDIHPNSYIQNVYNKHGFVVFSSEVLEVVDRIEDLIQVEQKYLNAWFDQQKQCYNLCPTAGNVLGRKHSKKTREKISKAHQGKIVSEETKKKFSILSKGRTEYHFKPGKDNPAWGKRGPEHPNSIAIVKLDKNTSKVLGKYSSLREAAQSCGEPIEKGCYISTALKKPSRIAFGYRWVKSEAEIPKQWPKRKNSSYAKTYHFINPNGQIITVTNLRKFCKENNLSESSMYGMASGKRKKCKGWRKA